MEVKITAKGHACFMLECSGYRTVIDPYAWGMVPGLPDLHLEAEAVYCSHSHDDHDFVQAVTICHADASAPYCVEKFITPHDDAAGTLRGMNTVHIFRYGDLRIAHLGDIGCFPDAELAAALQNVDCLLIPVGGFYTIDCAVAEQIVRTVKPRVTIPMHYRTDSTGFDVISHIDEFTGLFDSVKYADNSFTLTSDSEEQILVLNYKS